MCIRYTTTRQLGFFESYDELYWNVTGNGWIFPIDRAEVRIRLPQAVPFGPERAFYTGAEGATRARRRGRFGAARRDRHPHHRAARRPTKASPSPCAGRRASSTAPRAALAGAALVPGLWPAGRRRSGRCSRSASSIITPGRRPDAGRCPARSCRCSSRPRAQRRRDPLHPPHGLRQSLLRRRDRRQRRPPQAPHGGGREGLLQEGEDDASSRPPSRTACRRPSGDMLTALFAGGDSLEMDKVQPHLFRAARKALQERSAGGLSGQAVPQEPRLGLGRDDVPARRDPVRRHDDRARPTSMPALGERALPAAGFVLMLGAVFIGVNSPRGAQGRQLGRARRSPSCSALGGHRLRRPRLRLGGAERGVRRLGRGCSCRCSSCPWRSPPSSGWRRRRRRAGR